MAVRHSIYAVKTHLSCLLKQVRRGGEVIITDRGEPVAKIISFSAPRSVEQKLKELEFTGHLRPSTRKLPVAPLAVIPGGLSRFLAER